MAVNYGRKKIRVQGSSLEACGTSPNDLINEINAIVEYYKTAYNSEIEFEYDTPCYDDTRSIYAFYWRNETDAEMAQRIKNEERRETWTKEQEAREYARLKAKFEGNAS